MFMLTQLVADARVRPNRLNDGLMRRDGHLFRPGRARQGGWMTLPQAILALGVILTAMVGCVQTTTTRPAGPTDPQVDATRDAAQQYAAQVRASMDEQRSPESAKVEWVNEPAPRKVEPAQPQPRETGLTGRMQPVDMGTVRYTPPSERGGIRDSSAGSQTGSGQSIVKAEPVVIERKVADPTVMTDEQLIEELTRRLDQKIESPNHSLKPMVLRAAMSVGNPKYEITRPDVAHLSEVDRRILLAYQRTFTELGQSLGRDRLAEASVLENAAIELHDEVRGWRKMRIATAKLCTRVKGYGVYEEFGQNAFLAGRAHPVIVYAELDDFDVEVQPGGMHEVRLSSEVVLYNQSDGLAVWREKPVEVVDRSHNRRRDFFMVQIIKLSDRLTVGKYLLKLTVTDEIGHAVDEKTIPVEIIADPTLVGP